VISIKKFLSSDNEAERALLHALRLLVQGIGQHAVDGDAAESLRFRESMQKVYDALSEEIAPSELLVLAGSVLNGLEDHNRRTSIHFRLQTAELQNMLKMLTFTVGVVTSLGNTNVGRLSEIEKQVESTSKLDDVLVIKSKLADCLADIRNEAERQRRETGETMEQLTRGLNQARSRATGVLDRTAPDVVTGLPLRPEAELALANSGRSGSQAYAAVLVLDRLQSLNMRFGRETGDEVLVAFARMVRKELTPDDRLFRWSGPTLLALLPRGGTVERVRSEVARIMENKLEHTVQTASRSVMFPIAARWTVFPMMAAPRLLYQKIDAFAALPAPKD
jgi:GGDEF domain-containing protein